MTNGKQNGLTRRDLLAAAGAVTAAMAMGIRPAFAADTLKVGFISPRTGPLAGFGETDGFVLELVHKALANGIDIAGKNYAVEILDRDTAVRSLARRPVRQGPHQQ